MLVYTVSMHFPHVLCYPRERTTETLAQAMSARHYNILKPALHARARLTTQYLHMGLSRVPVRPVRQQLPSPINGADAIEIVEFGIGANITERAYLRRSSSFIFWPARAMTVALYADGSPWVREYDIDQNKDGTLYRIIAAPPLRPLMIHTDYLDEINYHDAWAATRDMVAWEFGLDAMYDLRDDHCKSLHEILMYPLRANTYADPELFGDR